MRKDITIEKIIDKGGEKVNKSALARQYGCCWKTIDRRLNPEKYKTEKKERIYKSKLDLYKNIIDEKIENNNIPATGIYLLLKEKYSYDGKYGILRKYVSTKKKEIITNLTIRFEKIHPFQDGNGRVGRIIIFRECLVNDIMPFYIEERNKDFYLRGMKEYQLNNEKGYLTETCLNSQDNYEKLANFFLEDNN
ncbi:MAG: Fic family protein [Bacilli bacterium]